MITVAQLFATFFAALVITKSFADLKRGRENIVMFLFWTLAWSAIVYIAYYPLAVDKIITYFGGKSGNSLGTAFGLSFTFLFFVIYRLYIKADRIEKIMHKLISDQAIKDRTKD